MINNVAKVNKLITDAYLSNLKKAKHSYDSNPEKYAMTHCALEDKPRTRHEARFPEWEAENWN